jgi:hypothetical protein
MTDVKQNESQAAQENRRQHLLTLEEVIERMHPLGRNSARVMISYDNRFPKPIIVTKGRMLFSALHVESYLAEVEREGFPFLRNGDASQVLGVKK